MSDRPYCGATVAGKLAVLVLFCLESSGAVFAQEPAVHYLHHGVMPPGAIGSQQLERGGPLPGFFQPVEIKAPPGALISPAARGQFQQPGAAPLRLGLLIGQVYRLRVANIPLSPGLEVFPTVELIDRLYAPADQQRRFCVPIELTQEDLELALAGKFVTRVIYLEDPLDTLPVPAAGQPQSWFEVAPGQDPLAVADALGRPMAILRMGGRLPDQGPEPGNSFLYGCPPFVEYPPPVKPEAASGRSR